ncbi:hypothetical protein ANCCEY_06406 [Ancylostoma ceylanicum]|uniref:Large ribosomal subunit protein mL40 n=1 Tax=Ancylostoma ceylanicum TaxID=53326 RepID=A0A0D6LWN5_9BILA|nr:hypothetical protein ANCCEY_06406 [Ancylostoma ceylanicum]
MKRQKKIDPEVAKQREIRRRKRLEKEIRQMQKHSKKPKPVDELTLDVKSAKNIGERRRDPVLLTEDQVDQRAVSLKEYSRSRNELQRKDDDWVRAALKAQQKALRELKLIDEELYQKAVSPTGPWLPVVVHGPGLTPPITDYQSPDGDYLDTTRSWT